MAADAGDHTAPTLLLLGPTASGKSAAALALATHLPIEIISVDSALVYRQMNIGTAKPSRAELAAVPHHLIDIIDPLQAYSAARFAADARRLTGEIRARGRVPLLVGGTLLYAKALIEGLHDLPIADPALRARLAAQARELGWPAMHARLAQHDPATAARLQPADSQRIQRALEVIELTGQPLSRLLAASAREAPAGERFVVVSLEPSDRAALHARIALRLDQMFAAGLLDEVRALRARGDLNGSLPSLRCVGYRQAWAHLEGLYDEPTMRERAIFATRQLAKRQLTWLRSMPDRQVVDCLSTDAPQRVRALLEAVGTES